MKRVENTNNSTFNYLIRAHNQIARIEKGLLQEELAQRVNTTRQTIGLIESGNYNSTLKICISICNVLHKSLDELFWDIKN